MPPVHQKQLRRYHQHGEVHELTFSCYERLPILTNNLWRANLSRCIDTAAKACQMHVLAFVFMPEHVHLLVLPLGDKETISRFLAGIKRPVAAAVKADLIANEGSLLKKLTVRERPGKDVFRFWQAGAGFDRNMATAAAITNALEYIHLNPVRRGLCTQAIEWHWSSAGYYATEGKSHAVDLPEIVPLSADYWQALGG